MQTVTNKDSLGGKQLADALCCCSPCESNSFQIRFCDTRHKCAEVNNWRWWQDQLLQATATQHNGGSA